jgi:hypothetical protein
MRKQIRKGDIFQAAAIGSHATIKNVTQCDARYDHETGELRVGITFSDGTTIVEDCSGMHDLDDIVKRANQYLKEVIVK